MVMIIELCLLVDTYIHNQQNASSENRKKRLSFGNVCLEGGYNS